MRPIHTSSAPMTKGAILGSRRLWSYTPAPRYGQGVVEQCSAMVELVGKAEPPRSGNTAMEAEHIIFDEI